MNLINFSTVKLSFFLFRWNFIFFQKPDTEAPNGNLKGRLSVASERNNSICESGGGMATPGGLPTRSRPASKMTKYVECWGADKPFANIAESTLAKNIELTVSTIDRIVVEKKSDASYTQKNM